MSATAARTDARAVREALALVVGIARSHRRMADRGVPVTEATLMDALARIEEYGCRAMPWLRDVQ